MNEKLKDIKQKTEEATSNVFKGARAVAFKNMFQSKTSKAKIIKEGGTYTIVAQQPVKKETEMKAKVEKIIKAKVIKEKAAKLAKKKAPKAPKAVTTKAKVEAKVVEVIKEVVRPITNEKVNPKLCKHVWFDSDNSFVEGEGGNHTCIYCKDERYLNSGPRYDALINLGRIASSWEGKLVLPKQVI